MDWIGVITPAAVVSAIVAGIVSLISVAINAYVLRRGSERAIQMDNVTKERAKWRDKIRAKSLEVYQAATTQNGIKRIGELHLDFSLNLNPLDLDDRGILDAIRHLEGGGANQEMLDQFGDRVALLLKHDWDRVKYEVGLQPANTKGPKRTSYAELQKIRTSPTNLAV